MVKLAVLGLFVLAASAFATPTYMMPEPSAIPELVLCVSGLGIYAWRRRKSAR
jgi:hypothetical protein